MFHILVFDSLFNEELFQYLILLDGKVVLDYCSTPRPESDLHLLRLFLNVNLTKMRTDVFPS